MFKKLILGTSVLAIVLAIFIVNAQTDDRPAPIQALETQGVKIAGTFPTPGGVTGYAGMHGQQAVAIYVTADGKQAIVGTMIDSQGNNLSQESLNKLLNKPMTEQTWLQLEQSHWIADGSDSAERVVYTFTDPNCPYCNQLWNDARPWITSGKVQLRHVIVAILAPTSAGKAAALLSAKDPQIALSEHEQEHAFGGIEPLDQISATVRQQLDANQQLMQQLGLSATPAILYKDASGILQKMQGAPSAERLVSIFGPR